MFESVTAYLSQYGYAFLFVVVLVEASGLPLPGESLIITAGALSADGTLEIFAVLFTAWLAAAVGDNIGYWIGRRYGRPLIEKHGAKVGIDERRFALVEEAFERYGISIVLVARFIIILRQLNGFVAGTLRMNWWVFLLYNVIGAGLWVGAYGLGGYYFGKAFRYYFEGQSSWLMFAIIIGICGTGFYGTYRFFRRQDRKSLRAARQAGKAEGKVAAREDADVSGS